MFTVCPWLKASHLDQVQWRRNKFPISNGRACSLRESNVCYLMERICTYFAIHFADISRLEICILIFIHPRYLLWFEWKMPSTVTSVWIPGVQLMALCGDVCSRKPTTSEEFGREWGGVILPFPFLSALYLQLKVWTCSCCHDCHLSPCLPSMKDSYPSGIMSPTSSKLHWLWFFITAAKT